MTPVLIFSALRPTRELALREQLDWGERYLDPKARRQLQRLYEYQGADVDQAEGADPLAVAAGRGRSTRWAGRG